MSIRTKVFVAITGTVVIAVWIVAAILSTLVTRSFERRDAERTQALVSQFVHEFAVRGSDVSRRVDAIAASEVVQQLALNSASPRFDTSGYYDRAQAMAQEQSLDFLDLVGPDGRIISSAEWPARFGYQEAWLAQGVDWQAQGVFLQQVTLADATALGLLYVRTVKAGDGNLYVVGGRRLDNSFLEALSAGPETRVGLYPVFAQGASSDIPKSALASALIDDIRKQPRELSRSDDRLAVTAIPQFGRDKQLLAILLVSTSRDQLASLKAYIQATAAGVGAAGVLLALLVSFWTASRVTRPLRRLTATVRRVAGGDWSAHAAVQSRDEVGQLAGDINHMTAQLTEQRDRMIQAERVAAWRELARRLAHELKNPLFPLQITVENLQRAREAGPEQFEETFRESTATLLAELDNLKTIIGRFSDFAKMPAPQMESVDINGMARGVMQLFDAQIHAAGRPPIEVALALSPDLPPVTADPEQIRRALRNLVLNALDVMPKGGRLTVSTQAADGKVAIEVSDTGEGLTPEECERLFTPYYTTKQHGTGLGLAIVQSVVSDHKGTISVRSQPGQGTTFRIELKA